MRNVYILNWEKFSQAYTENTINCSRRNIARMVDWILLAQCVFQLPNLIKKYNERSDYGREVTFHKLSFTLPYTLRRELVIMRSATPMYELEELVLLNILFLLGYFMS